ncbi:MAG: 4-(cytidine 5'-diphospho)-2-C-methyl-D-erythritol kinase [Deltaproteobacteria bacterium]|nr:4-(cytidine 5'-diphospho)-2-C-methyl-D-erythritol kinase [Deltaproteobacteria bacterium]
MGINYSIETPAKLNIILKVTGRRSDGYHDILSIMVPVDLVDHIEVTSQDSGNIRLKCEGYPVPEDKSNLVHRAAQSFLKAAGLKKHVSIGLKKHIPVSAGLGGGSSDAAATLLVLNDMSGRPLDLPALHRLAARLGADVPFFLYCRPAIATGIGEKLSVLEKWPRIWYVIVKPPISLATSWVYRHLKLELTSNPYMDINNYLRKDPKDLFQHLDNDLEPVSTARFPIINRIKKHLIEAGAMGSIMSGSGPSVFGIFPTGEQAREAQQYMVSQDVGDVFVAQNWEGKR